MPDTLSALHLVAAAAARTPTGWLAGITAIVTLLGALLGVLKYFNYRSRRDRIAAVGAAFESVVASLAADSDVKRLAGAIRLRRFFDPGSEMGAARAAYAQDALRVIAAILREQPVGNLQKLLADGLAAAPTLAHADLQRTNLQDAYLGGVDITGADLYRADLTRASLKGAVAVGAVFYQAKLIRTVLRGADLHDANFFEADLRGADLSGARLSGATFAQARNLPSGLADRLDPDGRYPATDEPWTSGQRAVSAPRIFVSRPSVLTPQQAATFDRVVQVIEACGAEVVTLGRDEYNPSGALADVANAIARCRGVVVLGFRQLVVAEGTWRPDTFEASASHDLALPTPWNQVEAGVAAAAGLPILIVREPGVSGGVFELPSDHVMTVVDVDGAVSAKGALDVLNRWVVESVS